MPGYQNNRPFDPTRGLAPQSEMAESDDERPLRTEQGPQAHPCEPRSGAKNQNEFAVHRVPCRLAETFADEEVLEWYRTRWQVELVFKRFKSLAQLGHLPKHDDESAKAWLYGKLLVALLVEKLTRRGQGRSGGFRTIMVFRRGERAFFVYGFAKSGRENLRRDELETFRLLADEYLGLDRSGLAVALAVGAIVEVTCDDQAVQQ